MLVSGSLHDPLPDSPRRSPDRVSERGSCRPPSRHGNWSL